MEKISTNIKKFRENFIDNYQELKDIKDDLIILALTKDARFLPKSFSNNQKNQYGSSDFERLEFLGDAVLQILISEFLFDNFNIASPKDLTEIRSKIVRNSSLICLSNNKEICQLVISFQNVDSENKTCADVFEAIIGMIYYYLKINKYPTPLKFILNG
jgi:ribonuclease-3